LSNLNLKNYDEATRLFEKALTNHPPRPVKIILMQVWPELILLQKNNSKALACLDSAAKLGYVNLKLVDSHDDFKTLREEARFKEIRERILLN